MSHTFVEMVSQAQFDINHCEGDMTTSGHTLRLGKQGQIALPRAVRRSLAVNAGDVLSLVQIKDVLLLLRREAKIPELSLKFSGMMQEAGVS